jgi:hypothetical protein
MSLNMTVAQRPRKKSVYLAFFLALMFGPLGLLYVSWQRCTAVLLLFLAAFFFIAGDLGIPTALCPWLVAPAATVIALGTRPTWLPKRTPD